MHSLETEALVVGAGMAGRAAAASLSEAGQQVTLVEARHNHPPNKSLYVNSVSLPDELVKYARAQGGYHSLPGYELVDLDDEARNVFTPGSQGGGTTGMLDHNVALEWLDNKIPDSVDTIRASYRSGMEKDDGVHVQLSNGDWVHAEMVVDASGDRSPVLRKTTATDGDVLLDDDPMIFQLDGAKFKTPDGNHPVAYTPLSADMGCPWIVTNGKGEVDIINTKGHHRQSEVESVEQRREKLALAVEWAKANTPIRIGERIMPLGGVIRVNPIPYTAATRTKHVYAVGGSAGMAEPLMAELTPAAIHWGLELGPMVNKGATPSDFYQRWRYEEPMFPYDIYLAVIKRREYANRNDRAARTTELYKFFADALSPNQQQYMLENRRPPLNALAGIAVSTVRNPHIIPNFLELGVFRAKEAKDAFLAKRALRAARALDNKQKETQSTLHA